MPHYKAQDGSIHFIEDDRFNHLIPADAEKITPDEAAAIRAAAIPAPDYRLRRLEEYRRRGVDETSCIEALIEAQGGHPEKLQALMAIRDQVRAEIPKD